MRQIILQFLGKPSTPLTKGDRAVLEAFLAVTAASASVTTTDVLTSELARRQNQPLTIETYRQRMKRLGDNLDAAKAPFRLVSSGGQVTAQPTLESDKDATTGAWLAEHSRESALQAPVNTVLPLARPENPLVMFSYAHLDGAAQDCQLEFFHDLDRALRYPPERYKNLKIRLWRDERDIRKAGDPGQYQMDAACREAFLGLIMMSDKYPHSDYCCGEVAHFIDDDGENCPGKVSLVVPVNVGTEHAPERFHKRARVWHFAPGAKTLLDLWSQGSPAVLHDFVTAVAEQIWQAAMATTGDPAVHRVEHYALRRDYEHKSAVIVPAFGWEGRLSGALSDAESAEPAKANRVEIVDHLAKWATGAEGPRLVALLGDFGMGKTVSCQLLTQELLKQYQNNPSVPLPVYFDLRNIDRPEAAGSTPLEDLIDQMLRRPGERPPAAREIIAYVRERDALIIFDGLDEATNKLTTEQAIRLYRELLSVIPADVWRSDITDAAPPTLGGRGKPGHGEKGNSSQTKGAAARVVRSTTRGPRLLVSCRTHYFRDIAAQRAFLIGQNREHLSPEDDIKVYYLLPFDDQQITEYLGLYLDAAEVERALALIKDTYNLQQLAARPIFLTFIRQTLGRIEADKRAGRNLNIARLYDHFVEQSLERDNPKHVVPLREKRELLSSLALTLHQRRRDALGGDALDAWFDEAAQALPKLRRALEGGEGVANAGRFLQDLRNASFLVRPGDEEFRFAHTSVREYFLANAVHKAICEGRGEELDMPMVSRETIGFILARQAVADEESQKAFLEHFPTLMKPRRPVRLRELAFAIWLASDTSLPRPMPMDLSGLDFSRRKFRGTEARPLPLARTVWKGTKLRQTEFDHVDLEGADFSGAIAPMSIWVGCRMAGAKWPDTELIGSRWRDCALDAGAIGNRGCVREAFNCTLGGNTWQPRKRAGVNRWRALREGHSGWVNTVALGRLGAHGVIVSGGDDSSVRVWDAASGECQAVLEKHSGGVRSVALGRLGARDVIVSGGDDNSVRVWDAASGECQAVLEGHSGGVSCVALGQLGMRDVIVSGGWDNSVRVWDAASGECQAVLEGHSGGARSVALGRLGTRDVIVSGSGDSSVRIWDAASGVCQAVLEGHENYVLSVALGRLGTRDVIVSGGYDNSVRVWDAVSSECLTMLEGHNDWVRAVALGQLGTSDVIVSGGDDNSVRVWDAASGECLAVLEGFSGSVNAVALGQLGTRDVIASGGYDSVRVWDAASGECLVVLEWHSGWVRSMVLGRLGTRDVIVSGGYDNSVRVWDAVSSECLTVLEGHNDWVRSLALGRLGTRDVIVSGSGDNSVRIWDAASGECQAVLEGHEHFVLSVALGRLGTRDVIVSGGCDNSVRVWDAVSSECLTVLEGQSGGVRCVALGRLGTRDVIVSGGGDSSVCVWDAARGECQAVLEGHSGGVNTAVLARLGTRDVIASGGYDSCVRIWDAASGECLIVLEGQSGGVRSLALGRLGTRDVIVSGGGDSSVRVWDAVNSECLAVLEGQSGGLRSVALGRLGTRDIIVSGGGDSVRIWDVADALAAISTNVRTLDLRPDALLDLAPDGAGGHRITRASPDAWRYYIAQGRDPEGRLVTAPIEVMMAAPE